MTLKKLSSLMELEELRKSIVKNRDPKKTIVSVCGGTGCTALGSGEVIKALREELKKRGLEDKIEVKVSGCRGFCQHGALVTIEPQGIFYQRVRAKDVAELVETTLLNGKTVDHLLYRDPVLTGQFIHEHEVPFYAKQKRLVLANSSQIDPKVIDDYIFFGGYGALAKALST